MVDLGPTMNLLGARKRSKGVGGGLGQVTTYNGQSESFVHSDTKDPIESEE